MSEQFQRLYDNLLTLSWHFSDQCHAGKNCDESQCNDLLQVDFLALRLIEKQHRCPVQAISQALDMTKSGATRLVKRLQGQGLVTVQEHPEDKRIRCLSLSDEGRACMEAVNRYQTERIAELVNKMGTENSNKLDDGLQALMSALPE